MIKPNTLKARLRRGETTIGAWVNFGSPDAAEILAHMGLDWLVFDTEHGPWSMETVQRQIQATAGTEIVPLVRVAWNDAVMIKRALDIGAYGVVVPWVNNRAQAEQAVRASRYAPEGVRGCGPRRCAKYGLEREEYVAVANELVMVIAQVETQEAVDNLADICSVEGIDAVFIGPSDLACSLGLKGDKRHPRNLQTIARILEVGKAHNTPVGIYGLGPEQIEEHIRQGFQFVVVGSDMSLMMHGLRDIFKRIGRN